MDRLCFGTFTKILQTAMQKPNSNQAVAGLLLDLIIEEAGEGELSRDFSMKPKMVSGLMKLSDNVHEDVVSLSSTQKVVSAMPGKFANRVIGCLVGALVDDLIENLWKLISKDKSISSAKRKELLLAADKTHIADFLSAVYLYALNKPNKATAIGNDMEVATEIIPLPDRIARLNELYAGIPRPDDLEAPSEPVADEMAYISELLAAYAEAEGVAELSRDALSGYPQYGNDLRQRRKEYYAAETIRRGTREVFGENDPDQFNLLKDETYDGIFDVHSRRYQHGYERLLEVMKQVTAIQFNKSQINKLPDWIGFREKKGMCHILVNDGVIRWVVRNE